MIPIRKLFLLLLFVPLLVGAQEVDNYYDYSELTLSYNFDTIISLTGSNNLDHLEARLSLFPRESQRQSIFSLTPSSNPLADIDIGDSILYRWEEFSSNYNIGLDSIVETSNIVYRIENIQFPIQNLDPEFEVYTLPSEKIDINSDIMNQAEDIVIGETDLYSAVFKLADWTKENINYDLNTITAEATLPSSWVLEHGEGVCDEITSLFISFARSVGIPARFVSGSAYSNVDYSFGNHGWAEVYFPDYGWVPYDVTFGEFAWLNPAHIDLDRTLDSSEAAISYSWVASGIDVKLGELTIAADVVEEGEKLDPIFDINLDVLVDEVTPGSYVPFMVTVENPFDEYTYDGIRISKVPSDVDPIFKPALLRPNQGRNLFWIVRVPDNNPQRYIYTSTVEAVDVFGSVSSDTFSFADGQGYDHISEAEAMAMISELEEKEEKTYSDVLAMDCNPSKDYYYNFEIANITCNVENIGDSIIQNLDLCYETDCQNFDFDIGQMKKIYFEVDPDTSNLVFSAKNDLIELYSFVKISLLDEPDLSLSDSLYPMEVKYGEEFKIKFTLKSKAKIEDLRFKLGSSNYFVTEKNEETITIDADVLGKYFLTNKVIFKFVYEDEYGNKHKLEETEPITVTDIPWYGKLVRGIRIILEKGKEIYYSL